MFGIFFGWRMVWIVNMSFGYIVLLFFLFGLFVYNDVNNDSDVEF